MAKIKIPRINEIQITGDFPTQDGKPYSGNMRSAPNTPKPKEQPGGQKPPAKSPVQKDKENK